MFDISSPIIKDSQKLDYDYVPRSLVSREGQMKELETLFRPLYDADRSCNAFLTGPVGTGKTVTAKRFCQDLREFMATKGRMVDWIYINCRNSNSESAVLVSLIRYFDSGYPDRGFSTEEMSRVLRLHLSKNKVPLVVILDEADILLKKSTVDIIYQLTRLSDVVNRPEPVSVILISQFSVFEMMDEASASTFRRTTTVKFNKYNYSELRQIVSERSMEALLPGKISDDALDQIAETSEPYGDARMALELLQKAAHIAENLTVGEITVEDIRTARSSIYSDVPEFKIESLDVNRKVVLLAVARAMKQNVSIPTSAAEKTYAIVCEEYGIEARKHTQFWNYIQGLEKLGLLSTKTSSEGKSGRTTKISLPDIPSRVLAKKLEGLLDSELADKGGDVGETDEMRPVRQRGGHLHQIQRDASLPGAFLEIRREAGQEGGQEADQGLPGRPDRSRGLRGQGQHGGPEADLRYLRAPQQGRGPRHNHR
jgi:cell division control protein 6